MKSKRKRTAMLAASHGSAQVTACCGVSMLTLYHRIYDDGAREWGYACKCGRVRRYQGNLPAPNDKVSDGGPLTPESKQDANPPFAAPLG